MKIRTDCRLCGAKLGTVPVLSLRPTPPANEFVLDPSVTQEEFPLDVYVCPECAHAQLTTVVDPSRLFGHYVYVAGTSPVFVSHFRQYADEMAEKIYFAPGDLVIDIGSNDGTLLQEFQKHHVRILGVDPAQEISARACASGIPTINQFFSSKLVNDVILSQGLKARLIVANNVFAHADDLNDIAEGVKLALTNDGTFVFEVSYLVDVCEKALFDTIYHEHLAYHTLSPLIPFFKRHGLNVYDAERIQTHGGSIRVYVTPADLPLSHRAQEILQYEEANGFTNPSCPPLILLASKIEALRVRLTDRLVKLHKSGKTIAAFGAPAKATTLIYHFDLDKSIIEFIIDDSPLKQGLFTPGKHVPVLSSKAIEERDPDYLVILAWNFADSIIKKNQDYLKRGGKFIVPIPEYREVSCD